MCCQCESAYIMFVLHTAGVWILQHLASASVNCTGICLPLGCVTLMVLSLKYTQFFICGLIYIAECNSENQKSLSLLWVFSLSLAGMRISFQDQDAYALSKSHAFALRVCCVLLKLNHCNLRNVIKYKRIMARTPGTWEPVWLGLGVDRQWQGWEKSSWILLKICRSCCSQGHLRGHLLFLFLTILSIILAMPHPFRRVWYL